MSHVKQFTTSSVLLSASKKALKTHFPSDCLFTFGHALYSRSNVSKSFPEKNFYRKTLDEIMKVTKKIKTLEDNTYGK